MRESYANLAQQVVHYCLRIKPGENVWMNTWDHTMDLASEIALECRRANAFTMTTITIESLWWNSLMEIPIEHLETLPEHESAALENTDAHIFILGPKHPIDWNKIPEAKRGIANVWQNKYLDAWNEKAKRKGTRSLGIEYGIVSPERAKALGLDYEEWSRIMLRGCMADYAKINKLGRKLSSMLAREVEVHITSPYGTDLKCRLIGRKPLMSDGVIDETDIANGELQDYIPNGCVEVAPDEDSAEGTVVFNTPIRTSAGKIENLTWKFKEGRLVEYSAKSNLTAFEQLYIKSARGDIDRFAFFGFGLNPELELGFTQDDKTLGAVTVGIGSNERKGGKNKADSDWWAAITRATVKVNRKTVLKEVKLQL